MTSENNRFCLAHSEPVRWPAPHSLVQPTPKADLAAEVAQIWQAPAEPAQISRPRRLRKDPWRDCGRPRQINRGT
jgi:hypothetical protein